MRDERPKITSGDSVTRGASRRAARRAASFSFALLGLAGCVAALAGCGGEKEEQTGDFDPFTAISQAPPPTAATQRAAPRWAPVATFTGSGPATKPFTIAKQAIQWRARWSCESGDLRLAVQPPPQNGKPLAQARCPRRSEGISIQTGPQQLVVTASGPWRVVIEQQVDEPLREPPLPGMSDRALVAGGSFYPVDKSGKGTASVYRLPNGRLALRFESFETPANIDLFVWLSQARTPRTTKQAFKAPHTVVREIKSTMGDQNYLLPPNTTLKKARSIVIWCEPVQNAYTAAALEPEAGARGGRGQSGA